MPASARKSYEMRVRPIGRVFAIGMSLPVREQASHINLPLLGRNDSKTNELSISGTVTIQTTAVYIR